MHDIPKSTPSFSEENIRRTSQRICLQSSVWNSNAAGFHLIFLATDWSSAKKCFESEKKISASSSCESVDGANDGEATLRWIYSRVFWNVSPVIRWWRTLAKDGRQLNSREIIAKIPHGRRLDWDVCAWIVQIESWGLAYHSHENNIDFDSERSQSSSKIHSGPSRMWAD